jgi:aminopeptidase N
VAEHAYGNVSTAEFIALAEEESGAELEEFFDVWLYERGKPKRW